eukprot:Blabericola_migrator_1__781@NODE_1196_length_5141_cov_394_266062_g811_i0_p2_GENE_NODE_1196_length_5141_cov_394_266062_g811_i0NODE_1196_length_5141_cov_394_266062_g811_i0_p2_ORF_typecomplete_len315_score27_72Cyclin/PF08613_11/3_6e15Cyclin_N/PF00134_23/1_6e05_NODE_1196_length_5141_cov_394_266062_g811_i07001644
MLSSFRATWTSQHVGLLEQSLELHRAWVTSTIGSVSDDNLTTCQMSGSSSCSTSASANLLQPLHSFPCEPLTKPVSSCDWPADADKDVEFFSISLLRYVWLSVNEKRSIKTNSTSLSQVPAYFHDVFQDPRYELPEHYNELALWGPWLQSFACRVSATPSPCLLVALIYLDRLLARRSDFYFTRGNAFRLMICSITTAAKYLDDHSGPSGLLIDKVSDWIQPRLMRVLECIFLSLLDYRLYVSSRCYSNAQRVAKDLSIQSDEDFCAETAPPPEITNGLSFLWSQADVPLIDDFDGQYWAEEFGPIENADQDVD